ncbi:MAG: hypothetical protein WCK39_00220 [Methanomassiliicoccales archaeon]
MLLERQTLRVFLDSCVILECFLTNGHEEMVTLRHLKNLGVELVTSITVLGECLDQCKEKRFDPLALFGCIVALDMEVVYPRTPLRALCVEVDGHLESVGRCGSSCTDRTHFAYAIMARCDFFVTSSSEKRTLDCPTLRNGSIRTLPVTIADLRVSLVMKSRGKITIGRPLPMLVGKYRNPAETSTT